MTEIGVCDCPESPCEIHNAYAPKVTEPIPPAARLCRYHGWVFYSQVVMWPTAMPCVNGVLWAMWLTWPFLLVALFVAGLSS